MRISWIDTAKGIAIFFVVWGHMTTFLPNEIRTIVYSFHMPLFFFLSGLFLKKENSFKLLVKKRISSLLKPYIYYAVLLYIVEYFFELIYPPFYAPLSLKGILTGTFTNLWFLPSLFFSLIFSFFILRIKRRKFLYLIIIICVLLGACNNILFKEIFPNTYILPVLPFRIDVSLMSIPFVVLGSFFDSIKQKIKINILFFLVPFLLVCFGNFLIDQKSVDMYGCDYSNFFLFYIAAFLGIFLIYNISLYLEGNILLKFMGKNSLHIYALHKIFILPVQVSLVQIFDVTGNNFLLSLVAAILVTFFCILFKLIVERNFLRFKAYVTK